MRTLPPQPREAAMTSPSPKRIKRLIAAGHRPPRGVHPRNPRPCTGGNHRGPLLDTDRFDQAGGLWVGMGTCACCGSTVHRRQLWRSA